MFIDGNFLEKEQNEITMRVPDAKVMHDIIMRFYNQEINSTDYAKWLYELELYKCYDFLCIEYNSKNISNIKILHNEFEQFLDCIETIGYNDFTIKMLRKNIPEDYDLTKFPKNLLIEIDNRLNDKFLIVSKRITVEDRLEIIHLKIINMLKKN